MKNNLIYFLNEKKKITVTEISNFLKIMDQVLLDPISQRSYFSNYKSLASKFYKNGNLIFCKTKDNQLVGLSILYGDSKKYIYAYETYIGVLKNFNGRGIATELMKMELELAKSLGMKGIMTNCHKNNKIKMNLNIKMGFLKITDQKEIQFFLSMNYKWKEKVFFKYKFNYSI